jgi:predicted DCC family thiol-disulfide oxidoreductase YuxK
MIRTARLPEQVLVLYDGECRFCRGQIAMLRRCDLFGRLRFLSLHDPSVAADFPELSRDALLERMHVIDRTGGVRDGAESVRYLSRLLPPLWPLAVLLHVPGSLPLWRWIYACIARNRYRIAGSCSDGSCRVG